MAFPQQAFPTPSKLKRWPTYTPYDIGLPVASTSSEHSVFTGHCVPLDAPHVLQRSPKTDPFMLIEIDPWDAQLVVR